MKRLFGVCLVLLLSLTPAIVFASEAGGYSRGNAFMYFAAIAAVLIFGIHDVFRKRWLTLASAVAIPVFLYLQLPAQ